MIPNFRSGRRVNQLALRKAAREYPEEEEGAGPPLARRRGARVAEVPHELLRDQIEQWSREKGET